MGETARIGFVSLGCPKALVDSERILTQLKLEGYDVVGTYEDADLVVVNTCGFIDDAIEESLDAIGEAMAENGKVIVTGCLGVKSEMIRSAHPGVLAVTGPQQYEEVVDAVHAQLPPRHEPFLDLVPPQGIRLTPRHYAYLKISEGCNHDCSFCVIPAMRGRLKSRRAMDVLSEADRLVAAGVKELLVISQDTSAYGVDLRYASDLWHGNVVRARIRDLAAALGRLGAWVRLHYVYPYPHVDEIVPLMAQGLVLPYLDVPFQHASPRILKRMKRPAGAEDNLQRISAWRETCPEITIRSTFIVGFPGETDADFEILLDFLRAARIDRAGCFKYSPVKGAAANALSDPVPEPVKQQRYARFMQIQAEISAARLAEKVGRRIRVLVDSLEDRYAIARSSADAPDIDGLVYVERAAEVVPGEFAEVMVERSDTHDLYARPV
ncbi:MAG TPA: 30S ribosomal protein S12 methylthiotransferase RimO [Gammaproteobacteria bacterium]|nr:30S ribosomal protein S12 methylthiotransferase RimO [Gammaproteobacteria bacterium]